VIVKIIKEMLMKLIIGALLFVVIFFQSLYTNAKGNPKVKLVTSKGDIIIELYPQKAPVTVENFLKYVDAQFYHGTIFHRVIPGFMIQGGGFTPDMTQKQVKGAIKNEANNGLKNERGTIAMARTADPHSATAQFFINTVNNSYLNFKNETTKGWGYCVFGRVIKGMDVVEAIEKVATGEKGMHSDVPLTPVLIEKAVRIDENI
jgi:peptidyl-prolyl cis-trans isomerase B (cyclophilin B)